MILSRRLLPIVAVLIWDSRTLGQARDADSVLAATRVALGGDRNLAAVKTFVVTGRTRQLRGNNLVPIEFEISCELPDKYVRKDEFPAQDTDVSVSGFRGDDVIVFPRPPAGRGGGPAGRPGPGAAPPGLAPPSGATPPRGGEPVGPPPENRLYFADYRDVEGTKWPFRIRRAVGGNTIEETTFDRINVN